MLGGDHLCAFCPLSFIMILFVRFDWLFVCFFLIFSSLFLPNLFHCLCIFLDVFLYHVKAQMISLCIILDVFLSNVRAPNDQLCWMGYPR